MNRIYLMRNEEIITSSMKECEAQLYYHGTYEPGDCIVFESSSCNVIVSVDQTIKPARVYLPDKRFIFHIPLHGDLPRGYPPFAFMGEHHVITLISDPCNEYRNLACNPVDQRHSSGAFPHASANVETRDESIFFARNTIDGLHIASSHGQWPYLSWGIGGRTDAAIQLDFGRPVQIDTMVLYLRADFQHSGYWISGTVHLSDGFDKTFSLEKIDGPQTIPLGGWHTVTWARLDQLLKCETPSPYQSLRQWEFYGRE